MTPLDAVVTAREMLSQVTPLRFDCGRVCGGACCRSDEDGQGGMLLFPGEEALYRDLPTGFALKSNDQVIPGGRLLICEGTCDRSARPLSCRLFPLLPTEGSPCLDQRAWAVCPLMAYGVKGLRSEFVSAVQAAGRILFSCPEHRAFLSALHAFNRRLTEF